MSIILFYFKNLIRSAFQRVDDLSFVFAFIVCKEELSRNVNIVWGLNNFAHI